MSLVCNGASLNALLREAIKGESIINGGEVNGMFMAPVLEFFWAHNYE